MGKGLFEFETNSVIWQKKNYKKWEDIRREQKLIYRNKKLKKKQSSSFSERIFGFSAHKLYNLIRGFAIFQ
jgi:tetrahydromethanopterin S-methyltransferase subunit F